MPLASVTDDHDGQARDALSPDMGADELVVPQLTVDDVTLPEGLTSTTPFVFRVRLAPACPDTVTVDVLTQDGTASAPGDFVAISPAQRLVFAPGDTAVMIAVAVVGDAANEPDELFHLRLVSSTVAAIEDSSGTGTVLNDDATASVPGDAIPQRPYLAAAYPNPFVAGTAIEFGIARPGPVSLRIHDVSGRRVRLLRDGQTPSGRYRTSWDGTDDRGHPLPSGMYLVRLELGDHAIGRLVTLVR